MQTHTMEYYSVMKKKETLPFETTRMELEGIMLSEESQTEKDKYSMVSGISCWNVKTWTHLKRVEWCLSGDGGQGNVVYGYKLKTSR